MVLRNFKPLLLSEDTLKDGDGRRASRRFAKPSERVWSRSRKHPRVKALRVPIPLHSNRRGYASAYVGLGKGLAAEIFRWCCLALSCRTRSPRATQRTAYSMYSGAANWIGRETCL